MAQQTVRRYQSPDDLFAIGDTALREGRFQRAGQHYEEASKMAMYVGDYGEARRAARLSADAYEKAPARVKVSKKLLIYLALTVPECYRYPEVLAEASVDIAKIRARSEILKRALRMADLARILGPVESGDIERVKRISDGIRDIESQIDAKKAKRVPS